MFNLDPHTNLTILATFLFFVINYMCTNNSMSSDIMKMLSIKNKDNFKMVCVLIFAVAFYFISDGMVHRKRTQSFKVGAQSGASVNNLLNALSCTGDDCLDIQEEMNKF
tara:strand:- start:662 stop:988 length:327 start_codon:yes stop_codon:yes gene_type:complete